MNAAEMSRHGGTLRWRTRSWMIPALVGILVFAGALLAGCGGQEETASDATVTTQADTATTEAAAADEHAEGDKHEEGDDEPTGPADMTVKATDSFAFDPETISVKAGQTYVLEFKNTGSVVHSLAVIKADAELDHVLGETDEEHQHEELIFEVHETAGGESASTEFTAPTVPGDYVMACFVPGHADAGMVGTLRVSE